MFEKIIVKNVNLQQDEVDRLNNTIELKNNTIKYQQDQYLKLLRKVDCKEALEINYLLFTYDEIMEILHKEHHPLHDFIYRWFDEVWKDTNELYFSEDGIEVTKNDYWLVNVKKDVAMKFNNIDKLNRMIYKLDLDEEDSDE